MSRWLKITVKVLVTIVVLIAILWSLAAYYINHNNKTILTSILSQVNSKISGEIEVKSMETTLLKGFPGIAVSLKNVQLRDSLWLQHQHDFLKAEDIDVSLNILSLLAGNIKINKIGINNASIYVYTDSAGYSNTSLFKAKVSKVKSTKADENNDFEIRKIDFNRVNLIVDNQRRFKLFNFLIHNLKGKVNYPDSGWYGVIDLNTDVKNFAFNTNKGSFLKNKNLSGRLIAHYNSENKTITIDQNKLNIGGDDFYIGAKIDVAKKDAAFDIAIRADQVLFKSIAQLLSPNITEKLLKFAIDKPIAVVGNIIDDGLKTSTDPLIKVRMTVKNNIVTIPSGKLTNCNFTGTFTNKDTLSKEIGDENSAIRFYALTADYYNVPIKVDTFSVTNLARPIAAGYVTAKFPLTKLNKSLVGESFQFKNGNADVKLYCKADIDNFMFTKPVLSGNIIIQKADIRYLPKNMELVNSSLTLNFNQKDLNILNSRIQLGKSILSMECSIQNFLNFYYTDPSKIVANLKLSSPQINLTEFLFFLAPRKAIKRKPKSTNAVQEISDQLSAVLEASKVQINLNVNKAIYKKFIANNVNANISLLNDGIYFNKIYLKHADGSLNLTGNLKQTGSINKFSINTVISAVNVSKFFYAFDNFGQNSITNNNIKGYLSAKINSTGSITDKGNIVKRSMYGQVNFNLNKAALINFDAIRNVGKFAFPNRDLANIEINKLDGKLTLIGDKVNISPMQVSSSVLNFNVKGIYGLSNGTDISMDIPLRNPKKDEGITDKEELKLTRMKGIVLHLKAIDDGKGGVKIRWNKDHDK